MREVFTPNEILVRYDENGKFQGAHVADLRTIYGDDGKVVHREMTSPRPIKTPLDPAFQDVLSAVLTDALAAHQTAQDKIAALESAAEQSQERLAPPVVQRSNPMLGWYVAGGCSLFYGGLYLVLHLTGVF